MSNDDGGGAGAQARYTLTELAQAAGMTPRNVRAYQTRGLLPPPERAGRSSVYRTEHLSRLLEVRQLREAGVPLRLLTKGAAVQAQEQPPAWWPRETPREREIDPGVLAGLRERDPRLPERLVALGVLHQAGAKVYLSPALQQSVAELDSSGVPPGAGYAIMVHMAEASRSVANAIKADYRTAGETGVPNQMLEPLARLGTCVARDVLRHHLRAAV